MKLAAALICVTLAAPLAGQGLRPDADPRIVKLVAAVSPDRLRQLSERLVSFGTRSTLSDTVSATRGVGAARRWIHGELSKYRRLQVSFDSHRLVPTGRITREVELRNVVAILPGRSPRRVYISGHYDTVNLGAGGQTRLNTGGANPQASTSFNHDNDAPGANDDGSGTILTMELARVFAESDVEFDATLVFILWAGEEQRLFGSMAHAQNLAAAKVEVTANFNNDIVGNSFGGNGVIDAETVRVYSLGPEDSPHRQRAGYIQRLAATYVPSHRIRLMAREDRFGRGSDHSSFTAFDFPAVVFREANENFARQHTAEDKIEGVDFRYLSRNGRENAEGAATVALARPAPIGAGDRGASVSRIPSVYDATITWRAAPGAAAYRVYWRDTWTNDWQHSQVVGNVTTFTLPNVNIDDWVFGVSAIGPAGHESLVSAYVSPPRRMQGVKVVKP